MDQLQLRMPVGDVTLIADAIERDIEANPGYSETEKLTRIHTWLRYRLARAASNAVEKRLI